MSRFSDKVAVITGGGSGIGRSICLRFAQEGARVCILDVDVQGSVAVAREIADSGGTAQVHACDVGEREEVLDAVRRVEEAFGRVDILVNNAGIGHVGNLEQTTEADFDRLYRVNVKGVFNGMSACIGGMVEQGGGVILNLASIASKVGIADRFAYMMSKGAVLTMTLSVARDYIDKNIRCNCICPARIHTPFVDKYLHTNYPGQEEEMFRRLSHYQPLSRMGTPEEVAALAAFLCSDEAAFITGAAYDIDGGVIGLR